MQKLGEGYFYDVFDLENGRVLKKQRPFSAIGESLKGKTSLNFVSKWIRTWQYIKRVEQATERIKEKTAEIPQRLIGNPSFLSSYDYEQDEVILLMDYFENHSIEENKKILDKYVDLVLELLRHGVHDCVYKFKNSYGVNQKEEVVFIDFNEVTFSKKETLRLVKNRHWRSEAQFRKLEEGELKDYLTMKLEQALTLGVVEKLWGSHLKHEDAL